MKKNLHVEIKILQCLIALVLMLTSSFSFASKVKNQQVKNQQEKSQQEKTFINYEVQVGDVLSDVLFNKFQMSPVYGEDGYLNQVLSINRKYGRIRSNSVSHGDVILIPAVTPEVLAYGELVSPESKPAPRAQITASVPNENARASVEISASETVSQVSSEIAPVMKSQQVPADDQSAIKAEYVRKAASESVTVVDAAVTAQPLTTEVVELTPVMKQVQLPADDTAAVRLMGVRNVVVEGAEAYVAYKLQRGEVLSDVLLNKFKLRPVYGKGGYLAKVLAQSRRKGLVKNSIAGPGDTVLIPASTSEVIAYATAPREETPPRTSGDVAVAPELQTSTETGVSSGGAKAAPSVLLETVETAAPVEQKVQSAVTDVDAEVTTPATIESTNNIDKKFVAESTLTYVKYTLKDGEYLSNVLYDKFKLKPIYGKNGYINKVITYNRSKGLIARNEVVPGDTILIPVLANSNYIVDNEAPVQVAQAAEVVEVVKPVELSPVAEAQAENVVIDDSASQPESILPPVVKSLQLPADDQGAIRGVSRELIVEGRVSYIEYRLQEGEYLSTVLYNKFKMSPIYGKNGYINKVIALNKAKGRITRNDVVPGDTILIPALTAEAMNYAKAQLAEAIAVAPVMQKPLEEKAVTLAPVADRSVTVVDEVIEDSAMVQPESILPPVVKSLQLPADDQGAIRGVSRELIVEGRVSYIEYRLQEGEYLSTVLYNKFKMSPIYGKNGYINKVIALNKAKGRITRNDVVPGDTILIPALTAEAMNYAKVKTEDARVVASESLPVEPVVESLPAVTREMSFAADDEHVLRTGHPYGGPVIVTSEPISIPELPPVVKSLSLPADDLAAIELKGWKDVIVENNKPHVEYRMLPGEVLSEVLYNKFKLSPVYGKNGYINKVLALNKKRNRISGNFARPGDIILIPVETTAAMKLLETVPVSTDVEVVEAVEVVEDTPPMKLLDVPADDRAAAILGVPYSGTVQEFVSTESQIVEQESEPSKPMQLPADDVAAAQMTGWRDVVVEGNNKYIEYKMQPAEFLSEVLYNKFKLRPIYGKNGYINKVITLNRQKGRIKTSEVVPGDIILIPAETPETLRYVASATEQHQPADTLEVAPVAQIQEEIVFEGDAPLIAKKPFVEAPVVSEPVSLPAEDLVVERPSLISKIFGFVNFWSAPEDKVNDRAPASEVTTVQEKTDAISLVKTLELPRNDKVSMISNLKEDQTFAAREAYVNYQVEEGETINEILVKKFKMDNVEGVNGWALRVLEFNNKRGRIKGSELRPGDLLLIPAVTPEAFRVGELVIEGPQKPEIQVLFEASPDGKSLLETTGVKEPQAMNVEEEKLPNAAADELEIIDPPSEPLLKLGENEQKSSAVESGPLTATDPLSIVKALSLEEKQKADMLSTIIDDPTYKADEVYVNYTVKPGETLPEILAHKFKMDGVYGDNGLAQKVFDLNRRQGRLKANAVSAGDEILVPALTSEAFALGQLVFEDPKVNPTIQALSEALPKAEGLDIDLSKLEVTPVRGLASEQPVVVKPIDEVLKEALQDQEPAWWQKIFGVFGIFASENETSPEKVEDAPKAREEETAFVTYKVQEGELLSDILGQKFQMNPVYGDEGWMKRVLALNRERGRIQINAVKAGDEILIPAVTSEAFIYGEMVPMGRSKVDDMGDDAAFARTIASIETPDYGSLVPGLSAKIPSVQTVVEPDSNYSPLAMVDIAGGGRFLGLTGLDKVNSSQGKLLSNLSTSFQLSMKQVWNEKTTARLFVGGEFAQFQPDQNGTKILNTDVFNSRLGYGVKTKLNSRAEGIVDVELGQELFYVGLDAGLKNQSILVNQVPILRVHPQLNLNLFQNKTFNFSVLTGASFFSASSYYNYAVESGYGFDMALQFAKENNMNRGFSCKLGYAQRGQNTTFLRLVSEDVGFACSFSLEALKPNDGK